MTPALRELLSVMTGSDPNRMADFPGGCDCHECGCIFIGGDGHDYCAQCEAKRQLLAVLPEALPALLQQLAEREAEVERILRCVREMSDRFNETAADLRDAERAREEATWLLREVLVWRRTVPPIAETPRKDGGIFGRIAAFLAASGGKDNG